jgi:hypothetical protein
MPENAARVLYKKAERPKTDVLRRMSSTKVVMLPTQLLPCQNISLRRSEY